MEYNQILNDLKNKIYAPVYFFHGENPFYVDLLTSYMEEHIIDETNIDFNRRIYYGRDVNPEELVFAARGFPMMEGYQLILVKEAQDILNFEPVEAYIQAPSPTTILVFSYKHKKLDKRKTFYKLMNKSEHVVLFEPKKIYDNQLPKWIDEWVKGMGYKIEPKATMLLSEHIGTDLSRINNELQKLTIILKPGDTITENHVDQNIGISKDFNVFELSNALGRKDAFKALRIVQYFEANPKQNPLQMIAPVLYNYFIRILLFHKNSSQNSYKLASIIGTSPNFLDDYRMAARNYPVVHISKIVAMIKELDLKSKGVGSSNAQDYGPLKELVIKLCN